MELRPLTDVATELGLAKEHLVPYGRGAAKIDLGALDGRPAAGKLVLVSAVTPTKHGEGKTTTSVGLAMGLRRIGKRVVVCLREPSLGPVFGIKGGGTGGGKAQIEPAHRINLHFTGDMHAITTAHDLCAALVDNDLHFGAQRSGLDPRRVTWPRVLDINDRSLRNVIVGLGGRLHGVPRETRIDITAASEVMATLCMASDREDLRARLGRIVVGQRGDLSPVTAEDVGAADPMHVLLNDAIEPNLVQTREGGPAIVHGGPFANIAHGCSSVVGTRLGLAYADIVVTEAGFGFDLGGEKFLHLKCRQAGLWPSAVVLVATIRALASHGGGDSGDLAAVERGLAHLDAQIENVRAFGLTPVVAINVFPDDSDAALEAVANRCAQHEVAAVRSSVFAEGGAGGEALARAVAGVLDAKKVPDPPRFLYELDSDATHKIERVATTIYGADGVDYTERAKKDLADLAGSGHGKLPVCIAKTQLSFTDNPTGPATKGGFRVTVTGVRLSAGAGFLVVLMGDMQTMPGFPREPAALRIKMLPDGTIQGLMQNE